MNTDNWELLELAAEGYCCSQIMAARALAIKGEENPGLIQAMKALCGGIKGGLTCGALSGGACFLMILHEEAAEQMIPELHGWFMKHYANTSCAALTSGGNPQVKAEKCPSIISSVYDKCLELLEIYGYSAY